MTAAIGGWYRGWSMVGLGIVMVMLTVGSVTYGFSIYVSPVSEDLGLSREIMNRGLIFQHVGTALLTPFIGRLLDRYRVSTIVMVSSFALGGSLVGLSIGSALWPKALILFLPLSFAFAGAGAIASYVLVARWFRVHRGRAMAIVALGQSLSSILVAPLIAYVIGFAGWRNALLWQGLAFGVIMFLVSRLIVDHPTADEKEPNSGSAAAQLALETKRPYTFLELMREPVFWIAAGIVALTLAVVQATLASLVPLATGRGLTLVQGASLLSALGASAVVGKLLLAVVADKVARPTLVIISVSLIMLFILSLGLDLGYPGLVAACLACGLGVGSFFPIYSSLLADRFGAASLGTSEGLVTPMIAILSAVAIYFAGVSFDATGDYRQTLFVFSFALGLALLLAIMLHIAAKSGSSRRDGAVGAAAVTQGSEG